MKSALRAAVLALGPILLLAAAPSERSHAEPDGRVEAPPGWLLAGMKIEQYELGVDPEGGPEGGACPRLASAVSRPEGFVGIARQVDAHPHRGRRLALSAWVRAEAVTGQAGLWMRIDGRRQRSMALDNMQERPIRGTADWRRYQVVLDVPQEAAEIYYGALLAGAGVIWVDDFTLEEVGPEVPTTESPQSELRFRGLDFGPPPPP